MNFSTQDLLCVLFTLFNISMAFAQNPLNPHDDYASWMGHSCEEHSHTNELVSTASKNNLGEKSLSANTTALLYTENISDTSAHVGQIDYLSLNTSILVEDVIPIGTFDKALGWKMVGVDDGLLYYQITDTSSTNYGQIDTWKDGVRTTYGYLSDIFTNPEIWTLFGADDGILYFQITDLSDSNYGRIETWDGNTLSYYGKLRDAFNSTQHWTATGASNGIIYMMWKNQTVNYGDIYSWNGTDRTSIIRLLNVHDNQYNYTMSGYDDTTLDPQPFLDVLNDLKAHIEGTSTLTPDEINELSPVMNFYGHNVYGGNSTIITNAFDVVSCYEATAGPLFINDATYDGFPRTPSGGLELERAMLVLQQTIIDYAYTTENINSFRSIFEDKIFLTSNYFPGTSTPPADTTVTYDVEVECYHREPYGVPPSGVSANIRKPTGCYLAPGSIATINVSPDLVNKGYKIRVGAHSWDLKAKNTIKRIDRVSVLYDIDATTIHIGHPLGGNIYVEIPYLTNEGVQTIQLTNVNRSPYFSMKETKATTLSEWQNFERNLEAPFADFETERLLWQLPTAWIRDLDDPISILQKWDLALQSCQEVLGRDSLLMDMHQNYIQIDVIFRGAAFFPGYPFSNSTWDPNNPTTIPNVSGFYLEGPEQAIYSHFHEYGHHMHITKFKGENRSTGQFFAHYDGQSKI